MNKLLIRSTRHTFRALSIRFVYVQREHFPDFEHRMNSA